MLSVAAVITGRGDRHPLKPVIKALHERGNDVSTYDIEGKTISECADICDRGMRYRKYDCVVILGDRFEALAAANVATYYRIPIAHIHGGEASFGSFDNQIRDAITKLSHLHFVAHSTYRIRVIGLGEDRDRVHVVGAPGLDNLVDLPPRRPGRHFVVTWHPETLGNATVEPLVEALRRFSKRPAFWTEPNADPGAERPPGVLFEKFTNDGYIGACRTAAAVIGNSSSGIIEMPTLGVPTVNIGKRQDGRLKGPSIIDCRNSVDDIVRAINVALDYSGEYDNPYGGPGASAKIAEILTTVDMTNILVKRW